MDFRERCRFRKISEFDDDFLTNLANLVCKMWLFEWFFQFLRFAVFQFWMHFPSRYRIKVKSILGMTYDTELIFAKETAEKPELACDGCRFHMVLCKSFWSGYKPGSYHDFSSLDIPSGSFFFKPFSFRSSNGQSGQNQTIESERDFRDYRSTTYVKSKDATQSHCSKSSFFVQKFNFDFPRKIVELF